MAMLLPVSASNFELEVLEEKKAVLLACFHSGPEFMDHAKILEGVSNKYNGLLKVCLLEENSLDALRQEYEINGTPTFLIFNAGKEKGRMLGRAGEKTLTDFVRSFIP